MVYESDFYTTRRPYTRPISSSYTVTVKRIPHLLPYIAHKRLVTVVHTPIYNYYYPVTPLPIRIHSRVRPSVLAAELQRIRDLQRSTHQSYTSSYLNSKPNVLWDDESREIRARADALLRRIHVFVPRPLASDFAEDIVPERIHSEDYMRRLIGARKNAKKDEEPISYYDSPEQRNFGTGHLACVAYTAGKPHSRRRPYYKLADLRPADVQSDVNLLSYYAKNRQAAASAYPDPPLTDREIRKARALEDDTEPRPKRATKQEPEQKIVNESEPEIVKFKPARVPISEPKPEPISVPEPEPISEPMPEATSEPKPEPISELKPKRISRRKPAQISEPKPEPTVEPEAEKIVEPETIVKPEPEVIADSEPVPISEPEPEVNTEPELETTISQPEQKVIAESETEAVSQPEQEVLLEPEPEPIAEPEPKVISEPESEKLIAAPEPEVTEEMVIEEPIVEGDCGVEEQSERKAIDTEPEVIKEEKSERTVVSMEPESDGVTAELADETAEQRSTIVEDTRNAEITMDNDEVEEETEDVLQRKLDEEELRRQVEELKRWKQEEEERRRREKEERERRLAEIEEQERLEAERKREEERWEAERIRDAKLAEIEKRAAEFDALLAAEEENRYAIEKANEEAHKRQEREERLAAEVILGTAEDLHHPDGSYNECHCHPEVNAQELEERPESPDAEDDTQIEEEECGGETDYDDTTDPFIVEHEGFNSAPAQIIDIVDDSPIVEESDSNIDNFWGDSDA